MNPESLTDIGVELISVGPVRPIDEPDDEYDLASGRHRIGGSIAAMGSAAVESTGRLVGHQIGVIVRQTVAQLNVDRPESVPIGGFVPKTIQLTFGLKMTAGAGKAIEAIMSAGGEASFQVVVTLDRGPAAER